MWPNNTAKKTPILYRHLAIWLKWYLVNLAKALLLAPGSCSYNWVFLHQMLGFFGSQYEKQLIPAQLISVSFPSRISLETPTNKREALQVLISLLLANLMLFLEKIRVYMTDASSVWVGRMPCTGKVSAEYKVGVVSLLKNLLPQKQILSRCKIVLSHFLH